jgi:minor extracellular protease Epr
VLAVVFWAAPSQGVELGGAPPGGFIDVSSEHWAYGEINACLAAGIVGGYEDGTYHPERSVSRAQMAVYISLALAGDDESVPAGTPTPSFPDVAPDHWAYRYVEYAKTQNIVGGYEDGTYHPEFPVTRGQMAVYVARAIVDPTGEDGLASYTPPGTPTFPDVATDHWAYKHVEYCQAQAIVGGFRDGTYQPDTVVTRDQMAVYVQRAFELPIPDGPPAPDFTLQTLDGTQDYRLSDLRGMPVAIFFWTSWCYYCALQAPDLETLYQRYRDQGFLVLGVGLDDPAALQAKAEELGLTFPVGYNWDAGVLYEVDAVPWTFIVNRSGSITSSLRGLQDMSTLEAEIIEVL